jgi:protein SCO1/2
MNNKRPPIFVWLGLLFAISAILFLAWFVFIWEAPKTQSQLSQHLLEPLQTSPKGGDFILESATGRISLTDFRGNVVLLYFGYRSCPDICPTSLAALSSAWRELSEDEQNNVQLLFVSLDPERDTPILLKEYVDYFRANILGLTGTETVLSQLAKQYGVAYRKVESDSALGYLLDHSASIYLLDQQGQLSTTLMHGITAEQIVAHIQNLLAP